MTIAERIEATYYQNPWEMVADGIDLAPLQAAARDHRAIIQDAWDGKPPPVWPIVDQPGLRNFRKDPAAAGRPGFAYHDALRDQLLAIGNSIQQGYLVIPMVLCDFNTVPISALFGAGMLEDEDIYTQVKFTSRQDLERLKKPEINSGFVRILFRETERLRRILPSWIDVGVRLNTGPLSVAAELRGTTDLLYDMLEAPALYHDFMALVTNVYIDVRRGIHERAGIRIQKGVVRPDVTIHAPTTGVMICDDTVQLLSPDLFETCAAPYLNRVLETFGGGCLHSCGNVTHLLPVLARMPLLDSVEFGQARLIDWRAARKALPEKTLIFHGPPDGRLTPCAQALRQLREPRTFMYGGIDILKQAGIMPPASALRP